MQERLAEDGTEAFQLAVFTDAMTAVGVAARGALAEVHSSRWEFCERLCWPGRFWQRGVSGSIAHR